MKALASVLPITTESEAIASRNRMWATGADIPNWVNLRHVGLDQFFTRPEIAASCYENLLARMREDNAPVDEYRFIEPGAGAGAFLRSATARQAHRY